MWSESALPTPPAMALFYVVLSVLRFGILAVKHFEVWDRPKHRSSLLRDSHKASDWEYRNRAAIRMRLRKGLFWSLCMIRFDASLYIMHHYISCVLVHHYIIMHYHISCVFLHQYISCVWCMTIYHASLYIMRFGGSQYISCVWCITKYHASLYYIMHHYRWCVLVHRYISCITIYMMRFGVVGRKCNFA